jgi:hypothetical protein
VTCKNITQEQKKKTLSIALDDTQSVGECEDSIIKEKLYCNIILINYYYHCYAVKKELKTRFL